MPQKTVFYSDVSAESKKIGPVLIFERLWEETGINKGLSQVLKGRKFEFDVERAVFLTVLHRLMVSGSDRFCHRWCRDYIVYGIEGLGLHRFYRAMGFLGEELDVQDDVSGFSPRCNKDIKGRKRPRKKTKRRDRIPMLDECPVPSQSE